MEAAMLDEHQRREVERNAPAAMEVLRRTRAGRTLERDDRRQTAMMGLIDAVLNPRAGVPFESHMRNCIDGALKSQLRRQPMVRGLRPDVAVLPLWDRDGGLLDVVAEDGSPLVAREQMSDEVHRLADGLSPGLAVVLRARLRGATYQDIAKAIGLDWRRTRAIEEKAVRAVRRLMNDERRCRESDV